MADAASRRDEEAGGERVSSRSGKPGCGHAKLRAGCAVARKLNPNQKGNRRRVPLWKWVWNKGRGVSETILFPFSILASLYGLSCRLRILLYEKGMLPRKKVDCLVVSIGNLTVGGTGKTPFTIFLAKKWQERGYTVGIVSRGYRGTYKGPLRLVSDGQEILERPETAGDEPYLMAQRLKGIPILVSSDRYKGCQWLLERFHLDLILLDDGFQHIRLHRDLNILLVDATNPFGNGALLPRGALREPLSEVRRADVVIFTRSEDQADASEWIGEIERFGKPCVRTSFQPSRLIDVRNGTALPAGTLVKEPVLSFCGIGNPDSFGMLLKRLGVDLREQVVFRDHHSYQLSDLEKIRKKADQLGAKWVVTTEKDAVKIKALLPKDFVVWALRVDIIFWEDPAKWESLLFHSKPTLRSV
ncbi:tetraacyldisaccharide 4'-kinase [Nitrospiraceae bacterium HYJII51-Mn-bac16s-1-B09]|uniref:Tetraacyldisaccharide 4'-kinase n=1 Tax=Candidatus Manganitrophus noduliformans TaxID=2606439 RepID=A0A7X6IAZ5_9BACT|nr:tetraacyldisaccharide 4'-kinase [Candidatus Manganitrophus noduliformans]